MYNTTELIYENSKKIKEPEMVQYCTISSTINYMMIKKV